MPKKLVIVAGVLLLFLAACGSGKDESSKPTAQDNGQKPTAVASAEPASTNAAPTTEASSGDSLKAAFEPLSLLTSQVLGSGSAGSGQVAQQADPDLAALLLVESDLPSGFTNTDGDIGYSVDSPQGQMTMAARMFTQGVPSAAEMGPIVMSAALAEPPSALADFSSSLDQVDQASAQDAQNAMGATEAMGITFKDFSAKKLSDLGEGGMTMHIVMDMSGLIAGFGGSAQDMGAFQNGIAFDMCAFKQGERLLMVMAVSPAGQESPVDALALAKLMESRAQ
ncbi:MAG: hypothetical protein ABR978_07160 [Dehalococcoidia bacterium]|jgi:hypothetical protein